MFNLHVAIVVSGTLPVLKYGGTQRVMWSLGKSLTEMGCRVTFFCDSIIGGCSFANIFLLDRKKTFLEQLPSDVDVVHFNDKVLFEKERPIPYVLTIHGNALSLGDIDPNSIFVSKNHASRYGSKSYVYNGLDWSLLPSVKLDLPRSGYHFLGKSAWRVKNVKGAINVVNKLPNKRLTVLGGSRINFKMGFRITFSRQVYFLGMVNDEKKFSVMESSQGLIFPVTWHEPFGLAMIESLYAGCPVFATSFGSIPEIIIDSGLGFLSNSESEMVDHLSQNHKYNPYYCHRYVVKRFSAQLMAENYMEKYEKVLRGEVLNSSFTLPYREGNDCRWVR